MANVCGESCCGTGELCFANACVIPGRPCFTEKDCDPNQYCEPALGDASPLTDAGVPRDVGTQDQGSGGGQVCLMPRPRPGRCLDLPPRCPAGDAGVNVDAGECLPPCEYYPEKAQLKVKMKWRWGPQAKEFPDWTDVWSTPLVARLYDTNCDGVINELDPPNLIFISGRNYTAAGLGTQCAASKTCGQGILRVLDGATGQEIWSLRQASEDSTGFAGFTLALGDIDGDSTKDASGRMNIDLEIVAVTGEGKVVIVDHLGHVVRTSDQAIPGHTSDSFGWGGGLALADMNGDGFPEIAFKSTLFTTEGGGLTLKYTGASGGHYLSTFVDLDGKPDGNLELLTGKMAYDYDGNPIWAANSLPNGFPGVGDFDKDGKPEVAFVGRLKDEVNPDKGHANLWVLKGDTGEVLLGPLAIPEGPKANSSGGPPTVADFNGDGEPEIGVANDQFYSMIKPDFNRGSLDLIWKTENHDLSSSVTGSTVFDFEGDGFAEVIYNDECFLWVYDGVTGEVRFATPTTSFTATEASLVADVDGDGHAEMVMVSNSADPTNWKCNIAPWNEPDPVVGRPAWEPPADGPAYRGITLWGDSAASWVGTRTLWNQHSYHVTNICDSRDSACDAPNIYGAIPKREKKNWQVGWLNNFRQNVQDKGIFDAADATLTLRVDCTDPMVLHAWVRNYGLALLPAGVEVGFFVLRDGKELLLGTATTAVALFPGQVSELTYTAQPSDNLTVQDNFFARILVDLANPTFHECRDTNNETPPRQAVCIQ